MIHIEMDEFLTLKEVTEILKVSRQTVYRWISSGELRSIKIGKLVRIRKKDLEKFLKNKEKN